MQFRIVSVEKLPLGTRILRLGAVGDDVKDLQEQLAKTGFYFGKIDGVFGPLTQEALLLLQRTFKLRIDGIAGNDVIAALKNPARKTGRIIYAVKAKENLRTISRIFNVNPCAWEGIPGQGNPQRRVYPGMRLLLHQRALFLWNESQNATPKSLDYLRNHLNHTGMISPGWTIDPNGELICTHDSSLNPHEFYWTIDASPEVWNQVFTSRNFRSKLINKLIKLKGLIFGFDFSTAPINTIHHWPKFVKQVCQQLNTREHLFLVLPLILKTPKKHHKVTHTREMTLFWSNMPVVAKFTRLIFFEPIMELASPEGYIESAAKLKETLRLLCNNSIHLKSLLTITIRCWDWNLDSGDCRPIPYKKAKMVRAMNPRSAIDFPASNLSMITYRSHRQPHCLVYQTGKAWENMLTLINQINLLGIAIRNFEALGDEGPKAIHDSFSILPEISSPDNPSLISKPI